MQIRYPAAAMMSFLLASCGNSEGGRQTLADVCGPSPSVSAEGQESKPLAGAGKGKLQAAGDNLGEVVGQMSWHLCNARANGWIDDAFYRKESVALRQAIFSKLGVSAPEAASTPADGGSGQTAESSEDIRKQACLKAAGSDPAAVQACQ